MARLFKLVPAFVLALTVGALAAPMAAHAETLGPQAYEQLSKEEIASRFSEINAKYDLFEPMSDEDAFFVQQYGSSVSAPQTRGSSNFNWTKTGGGTTVSASGSVYHNGTFNYTWGANLNVTTRSGSTPKRMVAKVQCTSYGVLGESGAWGRIYDRTLTRTYNNTRSFYYAPSASYSAVSAVYSVNAWVDVTASNGDFFTVSG